MDGRSVTSIRTAHLGKILFNLSILGAMLCVASLLSFMLIVIYYLFLVMVLLCTLFLILVYVPEFTNLFAGGEKMTEFIIAFSNDWVPVIAPITAVLAAVSIALLALSRQRNVTARIVFAAIFLIVGAVITLLHAVAGGLGK